MGRFRTLFLEPAQQRRWSKVLFHVSQVLHSNTGGRYDLAALRIARSVKRPLELPPSSIMSADEIARYVEELVDRGWSILDRRLTNDEIRSLWKFALTTPCYTGSDPTKLQILDANCLSEMNGRWAWRASDILRQTVVTELLRDTAFHSIAQKYIGCRPLLTNVTLWFDAGAEETAAFQYHYDNDGPKFVKFFFFLSDLEEAGGAHYYIQRSHMHVKPRGFGRSTVHSDAEIWERFGRENEMCFAGKAGTILVEDTKGFHKGSSPSPGRYRLILQFQFSALDIPHIEEEETDWRRISMPELPAGVRQIMQKFVV
jgi:hypothetical protein